MYFCLKSFKCKMRKKITPCINIFALLSIVIAISALRSSFAHHSVSGPESESGPEA